MESIRMLLKEAAEVLRKSTNTGTPILDAELLLIHVMGKTGLKLDRVKLVTQQDTPVDPDAAGSYRALVRERSLGKPVQYITGMQEFMGLELYIGPGVLIPRPDTEITVEKVIKLSKGMEKPVIIDMCTGSGAIAVSLASHIPGASLWAVDISDAALECSRVNVGSLGLENRVRLLKSDLFVNMRGMGLEGAVDIIVSNPPYIQSDAIAGLDAGVRDYEPHLALDGGVDGLVYYKSIVRDSVDFLKSNGILAFEIGYDQGAAVKSIMEDSGYFCCIDIEKDLAGYDRCIWGYRKQ
ncbi:MAG: peptide chain release factor N(5)-glutamine methyltransferase [Pseudomonadota bacterium]